MKSTHEAKVVKVNLEEHPDADSLSLVKIDRWMVVVRTEDWQDRNLGVFIQPNSLVPNTPEFAFLFEGGNTRYSLLLDGTARKNKDTGEYVHITVRRFRGVQSFGLLIPAPEGIEIGENIAEVLNVRHYEPAIDAKMGGDNEAGPKEDAFIPCFDVEALKNYPDVFEPNEPVVVTEKINGCCGSWVYGTEKESGEQRMFARSHYHWKKKDPQSLWWNAIGNHPEIEAFCQEHPEIVVYGEVYGQVQKGFRYDQIPGGVGIRVFGMWNHKDGRWLDIEEEIIIGKGLPRVPFLLFDEPFDFDRIVEEAEGFSAIGDHVREGVVVRPMKERIDKAIGRVELKVVGFGYLEGKKKKKKREK